MKFRYLKSLIPAALSLSLTFGMVSCVGDLDISPIDPQVSGNFSQDEVFTKLYASLVLTVNKDLPISRILLRTTRGIRLFIV